MDKPLMLAIKNVYKLWASYMRLLAAETGIPDSYRMVLTYVDGREEQIVELRPMEGGDKP